MATSQPFPIRNMIKYRYLTTKRWLRTGNRERQGRSNRIARSLTKITTESNTRAQQLWKPYVLVLAIMQSHGCFMYGGLWEKIYYFFFTYPYAKTLIRKPTLGAI